MITPPRRRFRFSLRTFFVLIVLLAVPIAWWARGEAIRRERLAVLEWINDYNERAVRGPITEAIPVPMKQWLVGAGNKFRNYTDPDSMPREFRYPTMTTAPEIERVKAAFPEATVEPWPE